MFFRFGGRIENLKWVIHSSNWGIFIDFSTFFFCFFLSRPFFRVIQFIQFHRVGTLAFASVHFIRYRRLVVSCPTFIIQFFQLLTQLFQSHTQQNILFFSLSLCWSLSRYLNPDCMHHYYHKNFMEFLFAFREFFIVFACF